MIELYTIGFTQKNAEQFFSLLKKYKIEYLADVRLNNASQLAGYTKSVDLAYFLKNLIGVQYVHSKEWAPTKEILSNYRNKKITWEEYERLYLDLIKKRNVKKKFLSFFPKGITRICLLCSEVEASKCHRRLLANYLKDKLGEEVKIAHI